MKTLVAVVIVGAAALGGQQAMWQESMDVGTAKTYEHLATAIIAMNETEDSLVRGILMHHAVMAQRKLDAALTARGSDRVDLFEQAAQEITDVANEGGKRVQAIRQRLLKAGHHHHTDADTEEDYIFVDSGEKADLLAFARKVSRFGTSASDSDVRAVQHELSDLFERVIEPE